MESCIVCKFDEIVLSHVVEVYRFCDITHAATITQAFIYHCHQALEHRLAVILSNNIRVVGIDAPIVHVVLKVEECDHCEDVDYDG